MPLASTSHRVSIALQYYKLKVILPQPKDGYRVRTMSPLRPNETTWHHMLLLKLKLYFSLSTETRVSEDAPFVQKENSHHIRLSSAVRVDRIE